MEGKYLVTSKENPVIPITDYGAVNYSCEDAKGRDCESDEHKLESSFENKVSGGARARSCSCTVQIGECNCGEKKKTIQLEAWARYKTITMAVVLSLFGVWIVAISVVASKGQL